MQPIALRGVLSCTRLLAASAAALGAAYAQLPRVALTADDLVIDKSCRIAPPSGPVLDDEGDGVVHVVADGVTVELGGWLSGSTSGELDTLSGCAIRVTAKNVKLRAPRIRGFKVGVWASGADGLVVEDGEFQLNYAQRLRSTPAAEDGADWLYPHDNDANQWLSQHGAAIYVEDSRDVELARNQVRSGQNGILLDRVDGARVYDNDASFLSGWGLGLWRCNDALVSRNAFDFCVRGYSHGVYNRGQDSAGILMFEQCNRNVFVENSATHGGDGFFGFGGKEALGEKPAPAPDFDHARKGCNDNLFVGNDFSYAAAHGLELTFSFGNVVRENRFVENAICGLWGGYSQGFHIVENDFARNGEAGYGAERGAINIEHARHERIEANRFVGDVCGVRLWWDADEGLQKLPWAKANDTRCADNQILRNTFEGAALGIQVQGCSGVLEFANRYKNVAREIDAADGLELTTEDPPPPPPAEIDVLGRRHPVGARERLSGRAHIVMTEWGPYDWQQPLLQRLADRDGAHVWRWLGEHPLGELRTSGPVSAAFAKDCAPPCEIVVTLKDERAGLHDYTLTGVTAGTASAIVVGAGTFERVAWEVRAFAWTHDPRTDAAGWRRDAAGAVAQHLPRLQLDYGNGGPSDLAAAPEAWRTARLPRDHFGTLADARIPLAAGRYELRVTSDDGVRVLADGKIVLEDWTWHAPQTASAELVVDRERVVSLRVEHFELDGYATLALSLRRLEAPAPAK
jgi:nitrous oxidase accessory protein NosD